MLCKQAAIYHPLKRLYAVLEFSARCAFQGLKHFCILLDGAEKIKLLRRHRAPGGFSRLQKQCMNRIRYFCVLGNVSARQAMREAECMPRQ